MQAPYPSGKGAVCKTAMHQFDSDRRLSVMDDSNSINVIIVISLVILVCLSAFFSSCEMAYSTANRIKLKSMAAKSKRARLVLKMLEMYDKILSTVLIGNNIVNISASALAAAFFISLLGAKGVSVATVIMTLLVLIIGDISPKAIAKEMPEIVALRNAPLLQLFVVLFTPINILMTGWKKILMKVFPVNSDRSTTEDELLTYVEEVRQEGVINIHEEQMIRHVIEFDDIKVSGIFTPRIDVAAVSIDASTEEIERMFMDTDFSRLPVYQDTVDNIKGLILLKDFYREVMKGKKTTADIVKPVVFITKTIKISKLFRTLQQKHAHLAVIVDEHGGTLGIVTMEDIVEELFGEIWDEHDEVLEPVKSERDGSFTVLGVVNFSDMLDKIIRKAAETSQVTFTADDTAEMPNTTVANWIIETLGRLPKHNEVLTWSPQENSRYYLTVKVLKVVKQRVMEVYVTLGGENI